MDPIEKREGRASCPPPYERYQEAYKRMARFYRPGHFGDGFGTPTLIQPLLVGELAIAQEAKDYVREFLKQEDDRTFWIGCSNYETNRAFFYAIEATRLLCGDFRAQEPALKLLKMAIEEIEEARRNYAK